jgi:lysophospholipase L1-like esterase
MDEVVASTALRAAFGSRSTPLALLQRATRSAAEVYQLSPQAVTATASLASATTSIAGGILRRPKRASIGGDVVVDMNGDPHFRYVGTPSLTYGAASPDTAYVRPPTLTGGGAQAARWNAAARWYHDGQVLEIAFKCLVAAQFRFRLKIDGAWVTCTPTAGTTLTGGGESVHTLTQNSAGNLAAGSLYLLKLDFGSAAERLIEFEWGDGSFGGCWVDPTATVRRGPRPTLTLGTLGDSLTGGAGPALRQENYTSRLADLLGCDGAFNMGIGGSGYLSNTVGVDDFQTRLPDIVAAAPDILFIWGGQNDLVSTPAAVRTAEELLVSSVKTALPRTCIFVVGMWSPGTPSATRVAMNNALKAGAAAQGVYFIDMIDPTGVGATAPAWEAGIQYRIGDVITSNTVPFVCVVGHTSAASFDATKFLPTSYITGTGKAGATTGFGNADLMVQSDGIHQTPLANDLLERSFAAEAKRLLRETV